MRARRLTAEQAERAGLAARVVPAAELGAEARALAGRIAAASAPAVAKAKDCVLRALETPLAEGLRYEQCGRPLAACFGALFWTASACLQGWLATVSVLAAVSVTAVM